MNETPIPWAENDRAQRVLARLRRGPASTIELQRDLPMVHVARQIWELRHWYDCTIKTSRLPNNVAVYTLVSRVVSTQITPLTPPAPGLHLPDGWVVPKTATPQDLANCRSCGTLILWVVTAKGKRAPYNADGVSHFATCPNADRWRKPTSKAPRPRSENPPRECPSCHQPHPVGTVCEMDLHSSV